MPKKQYAADDELSWFDFDRYSPSVLRRLGVQTWAALLSDRVMYLRWIDAGRRSEVLATIRAGLLDFEHAGELWPQYGPHETDTVSIRLMRHGEAHELGTSGRVQLCDDLGAPVDLDGSKLVPGSDGRLVAHLVVDLHATHAQLGSDFKHWLEAISKYGGRTPNRDYSEKVRTWVNQLYLPYFDLMLYARAAEKHISQRKLGELLLLDLSGDYEERLKQAHRALKLFTPQTAAALDLWARRYASLSDGRPHTARRGA